METLDYGEIYQDILNTASLKVTRKQLSSDKE